MIWVKYLSEWWRRYRYWRQMEKDTADTLNRGRNLK